MIASLTGRLVHKTPAHLVVDVQGIGYQLFIPLSTYYALPSTGELTHLHVHTHVREDAIQLFGFLTEGEKDAFLLLTTVSGIGPKLGLSVLSALPLSDLISAVKSGDVEKLETVPGIGAKSAGRIALELKDKVDRLQTGGAAGAPDPTRSGDGLYEDALSALLNLGYRAPDVKTVLKRIPLDRAVLKDVIRTALQELAKG